jgi:Tol biopolymer transport system component/predicted Ser/Thr protein kinase
VVTASGGSRLGPYELLSRIGAGGMGEVWKARDTRVGRTVAIKVSHSQFSDRFEREARAIAALNHPNICHLYDVGPNYIVMEYIEGAPIRGPLSIGDVVKYAAQICHALEAAHHTGIVHRDLKPSNILLAKSGIKLLDFGLAKQNCDHTDADVTVTTELTREGQIVGTLQYMAPEQLEGKEADARTDIFALGLVLYEMATGKRTFPQHSLERPTPPALERVVNACLERDPENRWQTARDLRRELEWMAQNLASPSSRSFGKRPVFWSVATGLALLTLGGLFGIASLRRFSQAAPVLSLELTAPPKTLLGNELVLSPDGRAIVFVGLTEGRTQLWMRSLDSSAAQPLVGTEDGRLPFWAPDSRSVAFFAERKLKRIDVFSGPPRIVCDITGPGGGGGTWNRDGVIVFAPSTGGALERVNAIGGPRSAVTSMDETPGAISHRLPVFLPDGRHLLYAVIGGEMRGVYVRTLSTQTKGDRKLLLSDTSAAIYANGHLLYMRGEALMAQPYSPDRSEFSGEAFRVAEKIARSSLEGGYSFSASANMLAFRTGASGFSYQLAWLDRQGRQLESVGQPGPWLNPVLSPDGTRVAAERREADLDTIWIIELARGVLSRLTHDSGVSWYPVWSPDGRRIAFQSRERKGIVVRLANGSGEDELILSGGGAPRSWSPDGQFLAIGGGSQAVLALRGEQKPESLLKTPFKGTQSAFSPDGRYLAYASDDSGTWQVYVRTFPASGEPWQVSVAGGVQPSWRHDGKEMFYLSANKKVTAVDVNIDAKTGFRTGPPHELFPVRFDGPPEWWYVYAPALDGKRFLVANLANEATANPIQIVFNWRTPGAAK